MREIDTMQEMDLLDNGTKMNVFCTNWDEFFGKMKTERLQKFLKQFLEEENYEMCSILQTELDKR